MFYNRTREQVERSLTCGENYRPKEITDSKFYFHQGFLIRLHADGSYHLYDNRLYSSFSTGDSLKYIMKEIAKIRLEDFDREENLRKRIEKEMLKRISPLIQDLVQEVLDKQGE